MKLITRYKEFDEDEKKSLLDFISDTPIPQKAKVLEYLKSGRDAGVRCSSVFDYIKNKVIPQTIHLYTDGEYGWDDEEIYHFETYNLELEKNFINRVLQK